MTEILLGFVGALALLILLFCGGLVGWFAHKTFTKHTTPTAEPLTEKERRKLIAEQQAWKQMQNYNLETAYGMTDQGGDS